MSEPFYHGAAGKELERIIQNPPPSTAATQGPFHKEESGLRALARSLGTSAGKADGWQAPGRSGAGVAGRRPLQAWVPRKRNLASFDALDEVSILSSQKQVSAGGQALRLPAAPQSGPNQQVSVDVSLRAPECLSALQGVSLLGRLTLPPAGIPIGHEGAVGPHACQGQDDIGRSCSTALGTVPAGSCQLPWRPARGAPSRRLYHKPFAPPRLIPGPVEQVDAPDRPMASSLASTACGKDELLGSHPAAIPHTPHFHPGNSRGGSYLVTASSGPSLDSNSIVSDSEASEARGTAPDRQPIDRACADVVSEDGPRSTSPLQVPLSKYHSGQALQQVAEPHEQDAVEKERAGSRCALSSLSPSDSSHCRAGTASPVSAAAARVATLRGNGAQSSGRRRLKRLYTIDDVPWPPHVAGPMQDMEVRAHRPAACMYLTQLLTH